MIGVPRREKLEPDLRPKEQALMTYSVTRKHLALAIAGVAAAVLASPPARADSTPVGPLPAGPITTTTTKPGLLVAVALPHASSASGLVWRIARRYDSSVVKQVSEADVGTNVVLVFKVVGRGQTSIAFAQTRGDASSKAVKSATYKIRSA
jgi:hypothetical protein